jgi:hypothetical protein
MHDFLAQASTMEKGQEHQFIVGVSTRSRDLA